MAQLTNIDKTWDSPIGKLIRVGNNRQIARELEDGFTVFHCFLHGSRIAKIKPHGAHDSATVRLDSCGYLTTTTIAAMNDFILAYGINAKASRAGGVLSVNYATDRTNTYKRRESYDGDSMSFAATRY